MRRWTEHFDRQGGVSGVPDGPVDGATLDEDIPIHLWKCVRRFFNSAPVYPCQRQINSKYTAAEAWHVGQHIKKD